MKKNNLPIYFAISLVLGMLIGVFLTRKSSFSFGNSSYNEQKIKRLINYIDNDYVDEVDTDKLLDNAIKEMLRELDPHSTYIPKENLQAVTETLRGNFVGIGVKYRVMNDTITVIQPIKGGPSIKVGIQSGDKILIANQDTLYNKGIGTQEIFKALKGVLGSTVKLKIYRKSIDSLFDISLIRDKIAIKSVEVSYMLNDSLGLIKLERFGENSYIEFKTALVNLMAKGMTSLVVDLRGNGGGFIHIANQIADEFLEEGKLIVFTKNNKKRVREYFATKKGDFEAGKVYILIDESSASASEILAGSLQDNDKGIIIGRRSFGKGLVQEERGLGDGSAVRLTTARYYTPTGRSIQKPYKVGSETSILNYEKEIFKRNSELYIKDSIRTIDSLAFKTAKGKVVYGGGGIIPDIFVPLDSLRRVSPIYFRPLNNFVFKYVDKNRKELSLLSIDEFDRCFDIDNEISNKFFKEFQKSNTSKARNFIIRESVKKELKKYLKLLVARECYEEDSYYRVNEKYDNMIKKVYELERNISLDTIIK